MQMKTGCVALVLCLNISVDPPDVIKISPCARMECWIGAYFTSFLLLCFNYCFYLSNLLFIKSITMYHCNCYDLKYCQRNVDPINKLVNPINKLPGSQGCNKDVH